MGAKWPLAMSLASLVLLGAVGALALSRVGIQQGYRPAQPIEFSHRLHAGDNNVPCLYCHFAAGRSRHAGIPPASVCMNCHALLTTQTADLAKLTEALAQRRPIRWIKVHNLPDFVYFNHSPHVWRRRDLPAVPRRGRDHGPGQPGGAADHGLVPRLPPSARVTNGAVHGLRQVPPLTGRPDRRRGGRMSEQDGGAPVYWKSLEDLRRDSRARAEQRQREFLEPLPAATADGGRRDFLSLMGFSLGAATLAACSRAPVRRAIPLLDAAEELTPGVASVYATTCGGCSAAAACS